MALWYLLNESPDSRERFYRENASPFEDCWHCGRPSRNACDVFSPLNSLSRECDPFYSFGMRNRQPRVRYFQIHKHPEQSSKEETSTTEKGSQESDAKMMSNDAKNDKDSQEKRVQPRDHPFLENMLNLQEVFPFIQRSEDGPFEMNVHLGDCDPDKLKVEFKDGLLKVEGRKESPDGSFSFVRHERTLPKGVEPSTLQATMLPGGTLKIRQHVDAVDIPVVMDKDAGSKKASEEGATEDNKMEEA